MKVQPSPSVQREQELCLVWSLGVFLDKAIYITERFNGVYGKKTKDKIKAVPLLIPTTLEHYVIYHLTCT